MKKILFFALILVLILSLASCDWFGGNDVDTTSSTTLNQPTGITKPSATTRPTSTTGGQGNTPDDDHTYNDFTASEKSIMNNLFGEVLPFIPNDEYYFETFSQDYDDGTTATGINFYAFGNTKAEFEAFRALFSDYTYDGTDVDEYGDTWYFYTSADGSYYVDFTYYTYEGEKVLDLYAYFLSESSGGSGNGGSSDGTHTYTSFTADEKALMTRVVGTIIPFLSNSEYYVKEYSYDYDDGTTEIGVNFYTFGNTKAEFDAYRALFSGYTYLGTEKDDYGDSWYFYESKDGSHFINISYYESYYDYVVDVYVYYITEGGNSGGSGSDSGTTDENVMTNAGAGLPSDADGVYDVNFKDAEYVKDVTDQGYYLDGCPTTGSPAVLVIPVQFSNVTAASKNYDIDVLKEMFCKDGETDYYSVYDYYNISSYGDLKLDITVLDEWFTPKYDSNYYYRATDDYYGTTIDIGDQLIMDEALAYLAGTMDLSKFDSDNNGCIDSIVLINTLDIGDDDFYWAYRYWNLYTDDQGYYYEYDGVSANDYMWASYQFIYESYDSNGNVTYKDNTVRNPYTFIHEFGHILGLDDYYDTEYINHPMDGNDMMDGMVGDHNAFSKFNLGWLTDSRLVVTDSSVTLTLEDFSKNGDTIIIANNWDDKLGAYQEYYIVVYYTNNGLNSGDDYGYFGRDGIVVYHINATLYKEDYYGEIYYDIYNNNTDASSEYGSEDNLIEFVKSVEDTYTYVVGSTFGNVYDDNGVKLGYTFTVDALTSEYATITFIKQ